MHSSADVPWTFDPQLELKQSQRASTMHSVSWLCWFIPPAASRPAAVVSSESRPSHFVFQVSSAVAPMFRPPIPSVKLNLGKLKPSSTFLTQMQSARLPMGKKRRESKSGFFTDRGSASGSRPQVVADQSLAANSIVAKAFASAVRRGSTGGGK